MPTRQESGLSQCTLQSLLTYRKGTPIGWVRNSSPGIWRVVRDHVSQMGLLFNTVWDQEIEWTVICQSYFNPERTIFHTTFVTSLYQITTNNWALMPFGCLPLCAILVHATSSRKYPRTNGDCWKAFRTVKALLLKNKDPYSALLAYRSTPLRNGFSPSELLIGHRLRTQVPAVPSVLKLNVQDTDRERVQLREDEYRSKKQIYHDKWHQARALLSLTTGEHVWVRARTGKVRSLEPTWAHFDVKGLL